MSDVYSPPGFDGGGDGSFSGTPAYVAKEKSGFRSCLTGCLIVGVLMLVIVGLGAWYVTTHIQQLAGSVANKVVTGALEQSELPEQEKAEIMAQVKRVTDAMSENRLSEAQFTTLVGQLTESPLFATFIVGAIEFKYLDKSGRTDEEKQNGRLSMKRAMHGLFDGQIEESQLDTALQHIGDRNNDGGWKLRDSVTDDELRAFLAAMKQLADDADIPMEVEEIDPSDELKRIIDSALNPEAADPEEPATLDQPAEMEMPAEAPAR